MGFELGFENNNFLGNGIRTPPSRPSYKAFWNIVGNLMVESSNYSYDHGELSNSQKRAIITLLKKKMMTGGI